jgi:hypothetical protein
LFCYFAPAVVADGEFFSFEKYVEFDVCAFAFVFPRVLAMFQFHNPPMLVVDRCVRNLLLKLVLKRLLGGGEGGRLK